MSATYFNRPVDVYELDSQQNVKLVETIHRNVREGQYRTGKFLVRYQKQWRAVVATPGYRENSHFDLHLS